MLKDQTGSSRSPELGSYNCRSTRTSKPDLDSQHRRVIINASNIRFARPSRDNYNRAPSTDHIRFGRLTVVAREIMCNYFQTLVSVATKLISITQFKPYSYSTKIFLISRIKFLILIHFVSVMVRPTLGGEDGCSFGIFFSHSFGLRPTDRAPALQNLYLFIAVLDGPNCCCRSMRVHLLNEADFQPDTENRNRFTAYFTNM